MTATTTTRRNELKARYTALLNSRTVSQLCDMLALLKNTDGPDAAAVRGSVYVRLCELVGDDRADELYMA